MADIIDFHKNPVTNIKKDLKKKEKELNRAKEELAFFKRIYSATASTGDLLKLQLADLESSITILQGHLGLVQQNLKNLKAKLTDLDDAKSQIYIVPSDDKPKK